MKRLLFGVLAIVCVSSPASAASFEVKGTIQHPNPASRGPGGITETFNPCGQKDKTLGDLRGVDGWWITLPIDAGGRAATMKSTATDMDVWFYDETCDVIVRSEDPAAEKWAVLGDPNEAGFVPVAAVYAIVDLTVGSNAPFTFAII